MANSLESSNPVPVLAEDGAAGNSEIHTKVVSQKVSALARARAAKKKYHKIVSKADFLPVVNIVPENVQTIS